MTSPLNVQPTVLYTVSTVPQVQSVPTTLQYAQPHLHQPPHHPTQQLTHREPERGSVHRHPEGTFVAHPERGYVHSVHRHWNTNVCDCCLDCSTCIKTLMCPCIAYAFVHRHVYEDQGGSKCGSCSRGTCCCVTCFACCSVFLTAPVRKQLRVKYNLPAKPCNDCCTMLWCSCCALAQEVREIEYHLRAEQNAPTVQSMKE
jgi:Cys-rich protein (TIGR01571 family)